MTEPFDRALPSPIAAVLAMRSSGSESVAVAGQLSESQQRVAIPTGVDERILDEVRGRDLRLLLISGSAGDGKSFTIGNLLARARNPWDGWPERVIEDATHSERPDQEQSTRLKEFFAPLERGAPAAEGPPLLIAMNTGMVIRFFSDLRRADPDAYERFAHLAEVVLGALRVPHESGLAPEPAYASSILVVNLDERPTTGDGALFRDILRAFDPSSSTGVMAGAARCETCRVRPCCWVRTNAEIVSSEAAAGAIDRLVDELALERGRPLPPRALWDTASAVVLGGAAFPEPDACDHIAAVSSGARADALVEVWQRALPNGVFEGESVGIVGHLASRDPSFLADPGCHDIIASAGIEAETDAAALAADLGAGGGREAISLLAEALRSGELPEAIGRDWRPSISRALARAAFLSGRLAATDSDVAEFLELLREYATADFGDLSVGLEELAGDALACSFGEDIGSETFFRTGKEADRDVGVHVRVDLQPGRTHSITEDPVLAHNRRGAEIAGYRPLSVELAINAGAPELSVTVNFAVYRLLKDARNGILPSASALERFYSLRRAAAALGAAAARDPNQPLLLADRRSGRRVRFQRQDRRGVRRYRDQEVIG